MPAYSRQKAFNSAGQYCRARLHAMVQCQYAESMVKLVENAVFWLMCPQEQQQEEQQQSKTLLYVRTNAARHNGGNDRFGTRLKVLPFSLKCAYIWSKISGQNFTAFK
jgi:hypothetical protein